MKLDRDELIKHCKIVNKIKLSGKILKGLPIQKIPVKNGDEVSDDSLGEIFCQFIELVVRDGKRREIPESTVLYFNKTFGEDEEESDEEDNDSENQEEEEFDEDFEDDEENAEDEIVEEEIEENEPESEPESKKKQTRKTKAEKTVVEDTHITKRRGRKKSSDTGNSKESSDKESSASFDKESELMEKAGNEAKKRDGNKKPVVETSSNTKSKRERKVRFNNGEVDRAGKFSDEKPKATREMVAKEPEESSEDVPRKVERGAFEERKAVSGTRATLAIYEAWVKKDRPPCSMKLAKIIHQEIYGASIGMPHKTVHTNLYRFTTTGNYHRLPKGHKFIDQKYGITYEPVTEEVKPVTKLRKGTPKKK